MVLVENYAAHHKNWLKCFNDPKMSDVVFEAKDGQTFHCEKFVLEVASPYFKELFSSGKWGSSQKLVSAIDLDPAALKWILRSCYTGDGDLNDDNVVSVMLAAKSYQMDWVEKACMKYLRRDNAGPVASFKYSKENEKWQEWEVPKSGWYHIVAMGAKSADLIADSQGYRPKGGEGAMIGGSFELKAGDLVNILTGGMSRIWARPKRYNEYSGGGGGTFVALKKKQLSLLLAAGGGGSVYQRLYGDDASLNEDGNGPDPKCKAGRKGGNGGGMSISTGGLGWNAGPDALAKPRGKPGDVDDNGGFGGGGNVCGGGGGYSGGAVSFVTGAGGGGSYVASEAVNSWKKVGSLGHGKVFIWNGKEVPYEENSFLKEVGEVGSQATEESIYSWEMVE